VTTYASILFAIRDERDYAAALDEFDSLVLSEPGTPPGRRFDELVQLIDDYAARRNRALLALRTRGQQAQQRGDNVVTLQQRIGKPRQVFQGPPR
jgi:antitoxin component HigA of HigAB toxin-antitoxin module